MPMAAITDYTFSDLDVEQAILSAAGLELRSGNNKQVSALKSLVAEADAVITQFAPINADVIGAMQRAKVVVRYGIGYDNVDVKAARERGIPVCNIPDYCIDEVAVETATIMLKEWLVADSGYSQADAYCLVTPAPLPHQRLLDVQDSKARIRCRSLDSKAVSGVISPLGREDC